MIARGASDKPDLATVIGKESIKDQTQLSFTTKFTFNESFIKFTAVFKMIENISVFVVFLPFFN
jgi:long-subunit fatty acid transport protein